MVRPRIRTLAGYTPGEQPAVDSRLVKLNTNENPYPASPTVARAVEESITRLHLYPEPLSDGLRRAAAERYGVRPESVFVGNGSDEILALCFKACAGPGDRIAYPVPTYSLYRTLADLAECRVVEAAARDGDLPAAIVDADARITFLCTPNSPLGYEIPLDQVRRAAAASRGLVVVDEAYVDFGGTTALSLLEELDNLLVLRTLSKSYSLAGARIGLAVARPELIAELCKVKDSYNVSRLAQAAGTAALEDTGWMEANVTRVKLTRERVRDELIRLGFVVPRSAANFLWVECGPLGGEAVYRSLRERGVLVRYFDTPGLRGGVRVTVGSDEDMDRFLEAITAVRR
ncbi:MAG TPA: histidinol-phosphate transaminase [Candidatus Binatia bacterium]|nr:histidinol-phosphate transaminase [Candidatus Binatia bacterium]